MTSLVKQSISVQDLKEDVLWTNMTHRGKENARGRAAFLKNPKHSAEFALLKITVLIAIHF